MLAERQPRSIPDASLHLEGQLALEMGDLLRLVASIRTPDRATAVRYTQLRAALLAGPLRQALPSFLGQCVSASKFSEFIGLYAADIAERAAFIDRSFEPCRKMLRATPAYDVFGTDGED